MRSKLLAVLSAAALLAGCFGSSPGKHLAAAKEHLRNKDQKSAVIEIKNALQKDPELAEARYMLGAISLRQGDAAAAEVELRKALAAGFPREQVTPELARSLLLLGQTRKVVDEFGDVELRSPAAVAALQTTLAAAYNALGRSEESRAALQAALEADPKYAPALIISARQKAAARDLDGALTIADEIVAREPENSEAWQLKGDLMAVGKQDAASALVAYRKALEVDQRYLPAHVAIIATLTAEAKLDEAAKQLDELKKFAGRHPQTQYLDAQLALQQKNFRRARELSALLVPQLPNDPRVLQLAGAAELQTGSLVQAEIYLSKALHISPSLEPARRLLIATYLRSGQARKALATLNAGTGPEGLEPSLYTLAGEVYLQNGDAKQAEAYFAKALKADPKDTRKQTALAVARLAAGQSSTALDELGAIAVADASVTADMTLISAHLSRRDYDKALVAIDRFEAKQPDKPYAANLRGRVQLLQKDLLGARKSFERALAIDPAYFAAAASLAALDTAENKPLDARRRFESVLEKNPKSGPAFVALAQWAAANGAGKDEVKKLLDRAIEANPSEVTPRMMLIDLYLFSHDEQQALAIAQSAVAAIPTSAELLTVLGRIQQMSGDVNQAVATYGKLVRLQPLAPVSYVRLAEAQAAANELRAAEKSLQKALEIKPDLLDAQRGLVHLALMDKRYPDAMKVARTVQEQRPKAPIGFLLEADIAAARKDWNAAIVANRKALEIAPSTVLATRLHALMLDAGKRAEADQFAASWMGSHPKDAQFLLTLGNVAMANREFTAAEVRYLEAIRIQPDTALALNNLAWLALQQKKPGALAYAEKANRLKPNHPPYMDTQAMILSAAGEHAKAIDLQKKALALEPKNEGVRLNLARLYFAAGDKPRARTELEALMGAPGPKTRARADAAALLDTL